MADEAQVDADREFARRFGTNLLQARKATGLSQEALAFETTLHRTEVGTLERGIRVPRLDTTLKLACILAVSIDSLVAGIEWQAPVRAGGSFAGSRGAGSD